MTHRSLAFISTFALAAAITPLWADAPAVSGVNGKLGILGGNVEDEGSVAITGSVTMPLGQSYGFQADGLLGRVGDDDAHGIGAHLFWRDPAKGMVGITASRNYLEDLQADRVGLEGELYLEDLTLSAFAGRQSGDVENGTYYGLAASYYLTDNMKVEATATGVEDDQMFGVGAEWQFRDNASAFLRATSGEDNESLTVGLQMTFGGTQGGSLKARHRYDDPVNPLFNNLVNTLSELRAVNSCAVDNTDRVVALGWCTAVITEVKVCNGLIESWEFSSYSSLDPETYLGDAYKVVDDVVLGQSPDDFPDYSTSGGGTGCL